MVVKQKAKKQKIKYLKKHFTKNDKLLIIIHCYVHKTKTKNKTQLKNAQYRIQTKFSWFTNETQTK